MQDLVHLLGPGWRALIPANAAAEMYAQHLRQLADRDPVLLLPYVFSLHVPILLGFMSRRIGKALGLAEGDDGLAFFTVRACGN
jgi:heme oxygenase